MILLLTSSSPILLPEQIWLEVAQDCVLLYFLYVCGRRIYNLSGKWAVVFDDPHSKKQNNQKTQNKTETTKKPTKTPSNLCSNRISCDAVCYCLLWSCKWMPQRRVCLALVFSLETERFNFASTKWAIWITLSNVLLIMCLLFVIGFMIGYELYAESGTKGFLENGKIWKRDEGSGKDYAALSSFIFFFFPVFTLS